MSIVQTVVVGLACALLGVFCGMLWERSRNVDEWRRWITLSERIDSVSSMAEHGLYTIEDRQGRLEERVMWLESSR